MPPHASRIVRAGTPLAEARGALVMVHGRGADARSILALADALAVDDLALLAPEATGHSWYPYSFLAPLPQNEPGLTSGLALVGEAVAEARAAGLGTAAIALLGFSQGACLTAEWVARNPTRYGGTFLLTGGLIGPALEPRRYGLDAETLAPMQVGGDQALAGTPVVIGGAERDAHVPLHRMRDTTQVLRALGAEVEELYFPGSAHTVTPEEITAINRVLGGF